MLILKVIGNAIFIAVMQLGVMGIVLSNFFAQAVISLIVSRDIFGKSKMNISFKGFKPDKDILRDFLKVGIPSVVTNVTMQVGFLLINLESMKYGSEILNTNSIANSITNVAYSSLNAFGTAITSMVSMNVGALNYKRAKDMVVYVFKLVTVLSIIVTIVMTIIAPYMSTLFVEEDQIMLLDKVTVTQRITIFGILGFCCASIVCGVFVAVGKTKLPIIINGLRIVGFRYPIIIIANALFDANYLIIPISTLVSNNLVLLVSFYLYFKKIDWNDPLGNRKLTK